MVSAFILLGANINLFQNENLHFLSSHVLELYILQGLFQIMRNSNQQAEDITDSLKL